jgi:hypothetical protein
MAFSSKPLAAVPVTVADGGGGGVGVGAGLVPSPPQAFNKRQAALMNAAVSAVTLT